MSNMIHHLVHRVCLAAQSRSMMAIRQKEPFHAKPVPASGRIGTKSTTRELLVHALWIMRTASASIIID